MKAWTSLFALTLTLGSVAACSSGDTTTTTGTSSSSSTATAGSGTGGAGGAGTGGSVGTATGTGTGTGGAGGGSTSASTSSASGSSASSSGSGGMAAFSLTSTGFMEGAAIPAKYSCKGADGSPDLTWTPGPSGTLSYAMVLTDISTPNGFVHSVIWDIPAGVTSLPANVEKKANPAVPAGAKQAKSFNGTFGYAGPCPSATHTYEFAVFALDVATLPNVTTASNRNLVKMEILNHDLGSATLTGTFTP